VGTMETMSQTQPSWTRPVEYPESDGEPMGETDAHADELRACVETLRDHFGGRESPDVYVAGNNFLYWVEGDPTQVVSPDCYVVKGLAGHERRTFKVWLEEGRRPRFVLELTSSSTRRRDLGEKMSTYRDDLQVPEYFLWDLTRDWIPEGLRGFRLEDGVYQPIAPDARGRLPSRELGLELVPDGRRLRFYVPGQDDSLPTPAERAERAERERDAAQAEVVVAPGAADRHQPPPRRSFSSSAFSRATSACAASRSRSARSARSAGVGSESSCPGT
jgi:Uma2 family endonuclease